MTKRSSLRFVGREHDTGQPFIALEPLSGDRLKIFEDRVVSFDLSEDTTYEEAFEIARYLNEKLCAIVEDPTAKRGNDDGLPPSRAKEKQTAATTARDAKRARLQKVRLAKKAADAAKPAVKIVKKRRWSQC